MDSRQMILPLLTTILVLAICSQDIPGWQSHYLEGYRFIPILGHCYQLYDSDDLIATCRREPDPSKQACIQWVLNDDSCLGLTTPTNETVTFRCTTHLRFDTCFEIYDSNQNQNVVCQEIFDGHAVGIKTPDNFTILFHSDLCRTATSLMEREVYSNFVNNFSLDVEARSCYKVYNQEEFVSPYNCLSADINEVCVFNVEKGCTALTTPNNEVLLLDCPDETQRLKQKHCFNLYSSDNQVHAVCQEKLEERCVGIVTPSNLTVLFECFFCSEFMQLVYYDREIQRKHRQFVKKYLADEYLEKNSHLIDSGYMVFNENLFDDIIQPSWIPKTSCFGFTLKSNETIFLKCLVQNENKEPLGCFTLISAEKEKLSVCAEVLNEACVGLRTFKSLSIALACYGSFHHERLDEVSSFFLNTFLHSSLINNNNIYRSYDLYKENETTNSSAQTITLRVQKVGVKPHCVGLYLDSEIIVLHCTGTKTKKTGCFDVIKRTEANNSDTSNLGGQVDEVCVIVLDDRCIGIITPGNWTLPIDCFVRSYYGPASQGAYHPTSGTGDASGFISENIPNYSPPRL